MHLPRTIRIFISSTFKDMHSERDYLVKFVFPELREKCIKKGLSLVDVDLRWGVSQEEAEQGKAIEICLDEIENCRPFFIGILGERYGWAPDSYQVPDYQQYDWLKKFEKGHSVTALEIYHGVLNRKEMRPRAFFYFRNPGFVTDVPEAKRIDVLVESSESEKKLFHLKEDIKDIFSVYQIPGHITENYPCQYKGLKINWQSVKATLGDKLNDEDIAILEEVAGNDNLVDNDEYGRLNEKQQSIVDQYSNVYLYGLEDFGNEVLADIWKAIDEEYPDEQTETNPVLIEKSYHNRFMDSRTRMFIGREDIIGKISTYLGDTEIYKPILITGEPGSGKSAVMAVAAKQNTAANKNGSTIIRFIGASPDSLDINKLVTGIIREIAFNFELTIDEARIEEQHKLYEYFREILFTAGETGNLTLFIDALNQLKPVSDPYYLTWLPKYLPGNVKIVLSSLEGDFTDNAAKYELPFLTVEKLSTENSSEILQNTLGEYRKSLTKHQIESILTKSDAAKPLYLKVASEELRVFTNFELINTRIENLPETIPDLFAQLLERLETDHNPQLVKDTMCLIECSMYGLLENELLELLKPVDNEKLPLNIWARLYRNLAPYLSNAGDTRVGLFAFFHQQLSYAVRERYLKNKDTEKQYFKKLATYGLRKYNLKNLDVTNTILFTGIYIYKTEEEDKLYNLLRDIFITGNESYITYEKIVSELFDWVVNTYNYEGETIIRKATNKLTKNEHPLKFCAFLNNNGRTYELNGKMRWALELFEKSIQILEELVILEPCWIYFRKMLSESFNNVGICYSSMGKTDKALEYFEKSLKVREELVELEPGRADYKRNCSVSYNFVANTFQVIGEIQKALEYFKKSHKVMEELVALEPDRVDFKKELSVSFNSLASIYNTMGEVLISFEFFEKSMKLSKELVAFEPGNTDFRRLLSANLNNVGVVYSNIGETQKALEFFEKSLKAREKLVVLEPRRTDFRVDLSGSINNLGSYYKEMGDGQKALKLFEKGIVILEELVILEPERTDFKSELTESFKNLGNIYQELGESQKALFYFERQKITLEEMVALEPERTDFKKSLSLSYNNLGNINIAKGEEHKALDYFLKSMKVIQELVALEPGLNELRRELSISSHIVARIYSNMGENQKALEFLEKALNVMGELVEIEPTRLDYKIEFAINHWNIYAICPEKERLIWLYRIKEILEPLKKMAIINAKLTQLWSMVNEAIEKIK